MSGGRAVFEAINGPPGKFLATTRGTTHYVLEGPEDAPLLVVLQHGIGGALSLFDRIAADLVRQGCRVLRYEFYESVVRALGRRTMVKFTRGACNDPEVFSPRVAPRAATARASWGAPRTSSARSAGPRSRCG